MRTFFSLLATFAAFFPLNALWIATTGLQETLMLQGYIGFAFLASFMVIVFLCGILIGGLTDD